MRIVLFHPSFDAVGGAEVLVAQHGACFRDAGYDVRLLTFSFNAARWASRLSGIRVDVVKSCPWIDPFAMYSDQKKLELQVQRASKKLANADRAIAYNYPCNAILGNSVTPATKFWHCNEPPRTLHLRAANPTLARHVGKSSAPLEIASQRFNQMLLAHDRDDARQRRSWKRRQLDVEASRGLELIYSISEFARDNARAIYGRCAQDVLYPVVQFPDAGRARNGLDRTCLRSSCIPGSR